MGNHEKVRCRNTSGDKPAWKVRGCDRNKGYCNLLHGCLYNRVLSKARTQYKNIAETLDGNIIAGNEHAYFIRGKVVVGASDLGFLSEYIEADDMVILGPQKEVQIRALESNASCIIVGCGLEVDPEVIQMANKKDCVIITTSI